MSYLSYIYFGTREETTASGNVHVKHMFLVTSNSLVIVKLFYLTILLGQEHQSCPQENVGNTQ